jgi:hypothetical protein
LRTAAEKELQGREGIAIEMPKTAGEVRGPINYREGSQTFAKRLPFFLAKPPQQR